MNLNINVPDKIAIEKAAALVKSKLHLYKACVRNGFHMPHAKASICTLDYLMRVRERREVFVPKQEAIKLKACLAPPRKEVLLQFIRRIEATLQKSFAIDEKAGRWPDVAWMVQIISTYLPNCEIFDKDYMPKPAAKPEAKLAKDLDNSDGFFTGLPELQSKKDLNSKRNIWSKSANSYEAKLEQAKLAIAKQTERMEHLKTEEQLKQNKRLIKSQSKEESEKLLQQMMRQRQPGAQQ
jgi:hypothetical protein